MQAQPGHGSYPTTVHSAFTLVEVLVALTLAALVVTIAGQVAVQTMRLSSQATRLMDGLDRDALIFDALRADFDAITAPIGEDGPLVVFGQPQQTLQVNVLSSLPSMSAGLHLPRYPCTVRYRLVRPPGRTDEYHLVRETLDRTLLSATPVPETLATNLAGFAVEVLAAGKWQRTYPVAGQPDAQPKLIRVTWTWNDGSSTARMFAWRGGV